MPVPSFLIAIDIDGTILRTDGEIAPEDRAAIAAALAAGAAVTLATGRLTSSTIPVARALGLERPLVCADGAVVFCPQLQEPLEQTTLAPPALASLLGCLEAQALAPFFFSHGAVHGEPAQLARFPWLDGWTSNVVPCDDLGALAARSAQGTVTAIGIGGETAVRAAEATLCASVAADDVAVFPIGATGSWVLRLTPAGCNKASGLSRLAGRLGIDVSRVAVIGDWYNDIPMFEWAGHSFAMGHAPEEVRRTARHQLTATAATGGGVAEALSKIIPLVKDR